MAKTNPPCYSCHKPMTDYEHYFSEKDLNDPKYTDDPGHYWLCRECDREDIRELTYEYVEPDLYDWASGEKIVY